MPYESINDLNSKTKKRLNLKGKKIFRKTFTPALEHYGDEGTAFAVSYAAAKKGGGYKKMKKLSEIIIELGENILLGSMGWGRADRLARSLKFPKDKKLDHYLRLIKKKKYKIKNKGGK